jgi:FKBP-type peptidyl-prolyl cis-trans isomerase FklB
MKSSSLVLAALLAAGFTSGAVAEEPKTAPPSSATAADSLPDTAAKGGYAIGLNVGSALRRDGVDVDPRAVLRGVQDGLSGAQPALPPDQLQAAIMQLQAAAQATRQERMAKLAESNRTEGAAFLKANSAKPGVVTLPDGLQYQILKAGTGPTPKLDDTVVCNYRGTSVGGAEFDSSQAHGGPASLSVSGVIKGWTEALQRMPVGSKWRLVVPADLAYGERGAGADIGPNAVLVFDIELLSIQAKA